MGSENNKTSFLDTLIEIYLSLEEAEKERLNDLAMKIYIKTDTAKEFMRLNTSKESLETSGQDLSKTQPSTSDLNEANNLKNDSQSLAKKLFGGLKILSNPNQ